MQFSIKLPYFPAFFSPAEQAAEKGAISGKTVDKHSSGPKVTA
jgi:hypothetical protein